MKALMFQSKKKSLCLRGGGEVFLNIGTSTYTRVLCAIKTVPSGRKKTLFLTDYPILTETPIFEKTPLKADMLIITPSDYTTVVLMLILYQLRLISFT